VRVDTVTFLFTDIAGSTALLSRVGERVYGELLADHHAVIRSALAAHHGTEVDTQGDGFFATFSSPRECLTAVLDMQRELAAHTWPNDETVRVRMGVHTGEAAQMVTGLVGFDVHRAARVAAVAHGGQVLVSETTATLVDGRLPAGIVLIDLGVHRLKDMAHPERLFQLSGGGLAADFPPLGSLNNPALRHNLPLQLTPFIGRSRQLAEVRGLVATRRIVTLTGAGGCGKTRLALQVAADLLDGSGDGVWLVELAAVTDPDAVAPAIAAALGIPEQTGRPTAEVLGDALEPQEILIILDNCEHLISAAAKVTDAIAHRCPRVHVLATSREPLGIGGEVIYRVPSLSLPDAEDGELGSVLSSDAVALFVDRAAAHGVELATAGGSYELVGSVCQRLDGMPLAIELAAARLRSMSLTSLHDRLDQRFRLLTGGSRTALERQQTLHAAVSWSYALLTNPEQLLLQRLAAFAGGFDLDAAEAVCGFGDIAAFDIAELLGSLVDKSLVTAERTGDAVGYRLLETIRQFAADRLGEADLHGADAVAAAHCAHFLALAEAAEPHLDGRNQADWFARLEAVRPDLHRALSYAASTPDGTSQVLRFAAAIRPFWARRPDDATFAVLRAVLDRPQAQADPRLLVRAMLATRSVAHASAHMAKAMELGVKATGMARELGDEGLLVEVLTDFSVLCFFAGDVDRGQPAAAESVERARRLGDDGLLGRGLMSLDLYAGVAETGYTGQLLVEALACAQRSGDYTTRYTIYLHLSNNALRAGDLPTARLYLEQVIRHRKAVGADAAVTSIETGWVLREEGNPLGARSELEQALRAARRTGHRLLLAYSYLGLACVAGDVRDWRRAAELHGVAQALLNRTEGQWQELEDGYRQRSLGQVRAALGADEFERDFAEGMALSFDAAFALATENAARGALSGPGSAAPTTQPGYACSGSTWVRSVRRSVTSTWRFCSGVQPGCGQPELATTTAVSVAR
jgi:predicted ATPase/class 3 adenylate cyclase